MGPPGARGAAQAEDRLHPPSPQSHHHDPHSGQHCGGAGEQHVLRDFGDEAPLRKDKDLWLAAERGLGAFRGAQGPRPGRQQEKAALNCSRNLPWLRDKTQP